MKTKIITIILIVGLVGCVGSQAWRAMKLQNSSSDANENKRNLLNLRIGMEAKEVVEIMGTPDKRESYQDDGDIVDFIFYRTEMWNDNYNSDDRQFTPLCLRNYKLTGWGRNFYTKVMEVIIKNQ